MAEFNKHLQATQVYQTLCDYLDHIGCPYIKQEDDLYVHATITGEDLFIIFDFYVDEDSQLFHLLSTLPFIFPEDKRTEGALASCAASTYYIDGYFDYDIDHGIVTFRMHESFMDRSLGMTTFHNLVVFASDVVDLVNDQFFMLSRGLMSLEDFEQQFSDNP